MPYVSRELHELEVPEGTRLIVQCRIGKEKHDSGYNCMVCTTEIGGQMFKSQECTDAIHLQVPMNIEATATDTFRLWIDKTEKPLILDGLTASMTVRKKYL
jgi:hypothetical protein